MKKLTIVALFILSGCVTETLAPREVRVIKKFADDPLWSTLKSGNPLAMTVTEGDLRVPYKEVGEIVVDSDGSKIQVSLDRMGEKAVELGVDAVVRVKVVKTYPGQAGGGGGDAYGFGYAVYPIVHHQLTGTMVVFQSQK